MKASGVELKLENVDGEQREVSEGLPPEDSAEERRKAVRPVFSPSVIGWKIGADPLK